MHPAGGPIEWPAFELEIPTSSPAAVEAPPFASWLGAARANQAALDAADVVVGAVRLRDLRRHARAETLALAAAYTRSLGIEVTPGHSGLLLCTGHQPVLVHPGIWIKYLAMARLVAPGGVGLNLIVDSDALEEVAADVPRMNGRLGRARVLLSSAGPDVPAEALDAPTPEQWRAFVEAIDAHLATLNEPGLAEAWQRARVLLPPPAHARLPGAITAARRALEGPRPYLDLPVSHLVRSEAFRRFALAILTEAGRFATLHNACLASYREHYGIRTSAQPFPDLAVEGARVEAPFWFVADGRRWPLFVDTEAGSLVANGQTVARLPADPREPAFASSPIRPRALTLTAFARLAVADLFIHGIGGGRYDRATDAIMRAFFGISPPTYATVTATLFLPFAGGGRADEERRRLQRLLLDLQHNPDRFLSSEGPHHELVKEKWTLIRNLDDAPGMTRRQRRQATQRIREINLILQVAVANQVADAQEGLRGIDARHEDAETTDHRGYPFLFFPVEAIEGLVELLARRTTSAQPDPVRG
jgi:hypothetical protein